MIAMAVLMFSFVAADVVIDAPTQQTIAVTTFSGNLTNLSQMADVNIPSPANGAALVFNSGTNLWEAVVISAFNDTHIQAVGPYLFDNVSDIFFNESFLNGTILNLIGSSAADTPWTNNSLLTFIKTTHPQDVFINATINPAGTNVSLIISPYATGDLIGAEYDLIIGGSDYGALKIGESIQGSIPNIIGSLNLNGTFYQQNLDADSEVQFLWVDDLTNIRFAIPDDTDGSASYFSRSVMIGGNMGQAFVGGLTNCTAQGYTFIDCIGVRGDLGVEDDLEVRGQQFTQGNITTNDTFHGQYDFEVEGPILNFNGTFISVNESAVNNNLAIALQYRFSSSIVEADPGSGRLRLNSTEQENSTLMFLSDITDAGVDIGNLLGLLKAGHFIYVQEKSNGDAAILFEITGTPIDNTTFFTIPIGNGVPGTDTLTNNQQLSVVLIATGGAQDSDIVWTNNTDSIFPKPGFPTTIVAGAYNGTFNWTAEGDFLDFDGSTLTFNDTFLNASLDDRYVNVAGDTMTGDLDMGFNFLIGSMIKNRSAAVAIITPLDLTDDFDTQGIFAPSGFPTIAQVFNMNNDTPYLVFSTEFQSGLGGADEWALWIEQFGANVDDVWIGDDLLVRINKSLCFDGGNPNTGGQNDGRIECITFQDSTGNLEFASNSNFSQNVTAQFFIGDGSLLTGITGDGDTQWNITGSQYLVNLSDILDINATVLNATILSIVNLNPSPNTHIEGVGPYLSDNFSDMFFNETFLNGTILSIVTLNPSPDTHIEAVGPYLFDNVSDIFFNETFLNGTIDDRIIAAGDDGDWNITGNNIHPNNLLNDLAIGTTNASIASSEFDYPGEFILATISSNGVETNASRLVVRGHENSGLDLIDLDGPANETYFKILNNAGGTIFFPANDEGIITALSLFIDHGTGFVGMGNAAPTTRLDVTGNVTAEEFLGKFNWTANGPYLIFDGFTEDFNETFLNITIDDRISMIADDGDWNVSGGDIFQSDTSNNLLVKNDSDFTILFVNASNERVGIGTKTPSAQLHVLGNTTLVGDTFVPSPFNINIQGGQLETNFINFFNARTLSIAGFGTGSLISGPDILVGSAAEGRLDIGASQFLIDNELAVGDITFNRTFIYRNVNAPLAQSGFRGLTFISGVTEALIIAADGDGITNYMDNSMIIGGDLGAFLVAQTNCTAQGFDLIGCGADATADLGIQRDLQVKGIIHTVDLNVSGNATFGNNTIFIDGTANRVGIGITNPTVELEIEDTAGAAIIRLTGGGGFSNLQLDGTNAAYTTTLINGGLEWLTGITANADNHYTISTGFGATDRIFMIDNNTRFIGMNVQSPDLPTAQLDVRGNVSIDEGSKVTIGNLTTNWVPTADFQIGDMPESNSPSSQLSIVAQGSNGADIFIAKNADTSQARILFLNQSGNIGGAKIWNLQTGASASSELFFLGSQSNSVIAWMADYNTGFMALGKGLGTGVPQDELEIHGTTPIVKIFSGGTSNGGLEFTNDTGGRFRIQYQGANGRMQMQAIGPAGTLTARLRMNDGSDDILGDGVFTDNSFGPTEWVVNLTSMSPGDVVCGIGTITDADGIDRVSVEACSTANSTSVLGVIVDQSIAQHGNPSFEFQDTYPSYQAYESAWRTNHSILELTGFQDIKVEGVVAIGDLLASSTTSGAAVAVSNPNTGTIVAKAMETCGGGSCTIKARINLM